MIPVHTLAEQLAEAADRPGPDLAGPALLIARLEYRHLDAGEYLDRLDHLGETAAQRLAEDPGHDAELAARVAALNRYFFHELGFTGNRDRYEDPRNSCLNEVIDRRTGIPITLSLAYIEVARRAGVRAEGVNFPGHFLVRALDDLHTDDPSDGLIVDPFHDGAVLDESDCEALLQRQLGEDATWSPALLARATRRQVLVRMLLNLKRLYVHWRSFPQARMVSDLLLALSPGAVTELRDRGLLAYHLNDFPAALRDLESYLSLSGMSEADEDQRKEHQQMWEHVKTLRRRVAGMN